MKTKILMLCMAFFTFFASAQFTIVDENDVLFEDGAVFTTGYNTDPEGFLTFYVTNTSQTEDIRMKIEYVSSTNPAPNESLQICFGLCYNEVAVGNSYPPNNGLLIAAGTTTGEGNHLLNYADSDSTLDYVIRFYQVDENDNEVGDDLTVTYRYDATLGLNDVENLGLSIGSTIIENSISIQSNDIIDVKFYDLQGRLTQTATLTNGINTLDVADFRSGIYLMNFTNQAGNTQTLKIVKK